MEQLTLPLGDRHARSTPWPDSARAWLETEDGFTSTFCEPQGTPDADGWWSRTSPEFFPFTEEGTSRPSCARWQNSGLMEARATGCLTLRCSEYPRGVAVSTLSSTLPTGGGRQRPSLTSRCATGLVRRMDARGRKLPDDLDSLLRAIASQAHRRTRNSSGGGLSVTLTTLHEPPIWVHDGVAERFSPEDYELIQGFPSGWTRIPWHGRPAERCPANRRYRAVGNSFAVPVVRWIGERIAMVEGVADGD